MSIISQATYVDHVGGGATVLNYRGRGSGSSPRDVAWYASNSGHAATPTFFYNTNVTRSVLSTSTPSVGNTLYVYGRNSKRQFASVISLNNCSINAGYPTYCGIAATNTHVTQGGDSGGPWYFDNTAYGIHHGVSQQAPFGSAFTPVVPNLNNTMNVKVLVVGG